MNVSFCVLQASSCVLEIDLTISSLHCRSLLLLPSPVFAEENTAREAVGFEFGTQGL